MTRQKLLDVPPVDGGDIIIPAEHALLEITPEFARFALKQIEKAKKSQANDPDFVCHVYRWIENSICSW